MSLRLPQATINAQGQSGGDHLLSDELRDAKRLLNAR